MVALSFCSAWALSCLVPTAPPSSIPPLFHCLQILPVNLAVNLSLLDMFASARGLKKIEVVWKQQATVGLQHAKRPSHTRQNDEFSDVCVLGRRPPNATLTQRTSIIAVPATHPEGARVSLSWQTRLPAVPSRF